MAELPETVNLQWCIARRPKGNVVAEDFELRESPVPHCEDRQILLCTLYLNLAPVMRMYMLGESAAGGVGSVVIQLAHILGCRVVGIAGGAQNARP